MGIGGQYRVLENLPLREKDALISDQVGTVCRGALVTINQMQHVQCAHTGLAPCAYITIDEGFDALRQGWVRCTANDGHDVIDTRNQLEAKQIKEKLEQQQAELRALEEQRRLAIEDAKRFEERRKHQQLTSTDESSAKADKETTQRLVPQVSDPPQTRETHVSCFNCICFSRREQRSETK